MEMSHRSKEFTSIIENAEANLRKLVNVPDKYKVSSSVFRALWHPIVYVWNNIPTVLCIRYFGLANALCITYCSEKAYLIGQIGWRVLQHIPSTLSCFWADKRDWTACDEMLCSCNGLMYCWSHGLEFFILSLRTDIFTRLYYALSDQELISWLSVSSNVKLGYAGDVPPRWCKWTICSRAFEFDSGRGHSWSNRDWSLEQEIWSRSWQVSISRSVLLTDSKFLSKAISCSRKYILKYPAQLQAYTVTSQAAMQCLRAARLFFLWCLPYSSSACLTWAHTESQDPSWYVCLLAIKDQVRIRISWSLSWGKVGSKMRWEDYNSPVGCISSPFSGCLVWASRQQSVP